MKSTLYRFLLKKFTSYSNKPIRSLGEVVSCRGGTETRKRTSSILMKKAEPLEISDKVIYVIYVYILNIYMYTYLVFTKSVDSNFRAF